jgi:Holliday junction resolvasome RuvABC ATP-dependent DNA helicase subunit
MKKLQNYIGQTSAKVTVNEIITDRLRREQDNDTINPIRPLFLSGVAGLGKTFFADAIADAIGWQFVQLPIASGIRELNRVAAKICSINDETGEAYSVPSVIFCDETHAIAKAALNIIKQLTEGNIATFTREGTVYHRDLTSHLWIFASNEKVDKAIVSRSEEIHLTTYNKGERKRLIQSYCDKEIAPDALEFLSDRVKETARECKALGAKMARQEAKKITLDIASETCKQARIWPQGLNDGDVKFLQELCKVAKPLGSNMAAVIMGKQGAGAKSEAEQACLYMAYIGLLGMSESGSRFHITKKGKEYLATIAALQAAKKAGK